jgi:signal peptidase
MKNFKYIYYIALTFVGLIALFLVFSAIPIPGNYQTMIVQSGSMEPAIKTGSIIAVKPVENYKIGDIITFKRRGEKDLTTHRIVEMRVEQGSPIYTTQGDANNAPDMREVKESEVTGKALFAVPYLGYAVDFAKKPVGFALLIIIPALLIIGDEIKKIIKEVKKNVRNE